MVSAQKFVVLIIPLCLSLFRSCVCLPGFNFRCPELYHSSWVKFKSYFVVTFLSLLSVLVAVGFFTLIERKVLSYIMLRKGPNKPSLVGIATPFADAIKLFGKYFVFPSSSVCSLLLWSCRISFLIPAIL